MGVTSFVMSRRVSGDGRTQSRAVGSDATKGIYPSVAFNTWRKLFRMSVYRYFSRCNMSDAEQPSAREA